MQSAPGLKRALIWIEVGTPFLRQADWKIGSHHARPIFVSTHNDLQEDFTAFLWQSLESHVVNDQQIGFEVFA
jgi:hypothetical protein